MTGLCRNPRCGERVHRSLGRPPWLCPSCRLVGGWGVFLGGLIVGAIAGLVRLLS